MIKYSTRKTLMLKNRVDKLSMAVFFPDRDTSNQEQPFSLTQDTKTLSSCASSRITTPTPILLERDRELVSTATVSVPQPESDSSYRITTSTASELVSTITVPAPQPELGFRFQSSEGSWSSSGSSSSSSDCALNDTFGHVVACRSHYESNEQIIQVQRNNGFKPSGIEPVVDVSGATIQTQVSRLPSVSDMPNESNEPSKITSLTNEFWDLQTKLSGMEERLAELLGELRCDTETSDSWDESYSDGRSDIQQPRIFPSSASASNSPISDSFSESSRTSDLHFDLHSACASLDFIRLERKRMEWILEDVKRECRKPMIVPALLELITIKTRRGGDSQV
ncbi:hypothetical protein BT96DRAFT_351567 [Gymnopus androsaceus JB14]|uniref:Uncharacterized protein n=1 Tax=Gymnopus androsaceus JB14 TaxID=1447944 RepID=A0A6A4GYA6_9AGAR|nr:hypothetical protein BT96DRAFT_351567 [Gymnopus androsaceus JB14]